MIGTFARRWPVALLVGLVACLEPLRDNPVPPGPTPAGAVILGAARSAAGTAVAGAAGEIDVFRDNGDGSADFVGGVTFTTDGMGEFAARVVLAYVGEFDASVQVVVIPPAALGLHPDTATGTVPFTTGVTDTLTVRLTLDPIN
jgi:hypothetical protein